MWLGLYFVSAKHSLAAHKVMIVVLILTQECHVPHMELYTNYIGHTQSHIWSHLRYPTSHALHDTSLSIIKIMCIDYVHYKVSYPPY